MKKIFLTIVSAAALLVPATLSSQTINSRTHFAGERITGVEASSAFDVVLVKSIETRAVVEINDQLAPYVRISRGTDGVVSIGLHGDMPNRLWREFNRLHDHQQVIRLTLYLPSVGTIRLSGASELHSSDAHTGEDVDIQLSGASEIEGSLNISARRVKLQASGASEASLMLPATRDLVVVASGASEIDIKARGLTYSKLGASGASEIEIEGDGENGDWSASGASQIDGEDFATKDLTVTASGASSIQCNTSGTLNAKTSGASSVRYRGMPSRVNTSNNSVRPL